MADQQTEASVEQTEAPTTETQATDQAQPDVLAQLSQRLDGLPQQIVQGLSEAFQGQEQPDPYQDPYGQQNDPYGAQNDPYQGLDPNDPRDAALLQMQQQYQQLQQTTQQMSSQVYNREASDLMNKYPDLQKDEVAGPVVDQARQIVQALGGDPRSSRIPAAVIKTAYKAWKADQIASQQQPMDNGQGVTLEGAGAVQQQAPVNEAEELLGVVNKPGSNVFGL